MSNIARQGQINKLSAELRDMLENGLETDGTECGDGSPSWWGTGTGEDFDGFTLYSIPTNDAEDDDMIDQLPAIAWQIERAPIETTLDHRTFYDAQISFEIRIPFHMTKTIDSTVHQYGELLNWQLERLQYGLDRMFLTSVNVSAGPVCTGAMNLGRVDDESDIVYVGQAFCNVQFLVEVS